MIVWAVDAILCLVIVEAIVLVVYRQSTGRGIAARAILGTLAAGFFLICALRFALVNASAGPVAVCLLASLVAHIVDLSLRWR